MSRLCRNKLRHKARKATFWKTGIALGLVACRAPCRFARGAAQSCRRTGSRRGTARRGSFVRRRPSEKAALNLRRRGLLPGLICARWRRVLRSENATARMSPQRASPKDIARIGNALAKGRLGGAMGRRGEPFFDGELPIPRPPSRRASGQMRLSPDARTCRRASRLSRGSTWRQKLTRPRAHKPGSTWSSGEHRQISKRIRAGRQRQLEACRWPITVAGAGPGPPGPRRKFGIALITEKTPLMILRPNRNLLLLAAPAHDKENHLALYG